MRWIPEYLTGRKSFVRIGSTLSDSFEVHTGVSQGGVLGPLLFNAMLADMPQTRAIDNHCYADYLSFSAISDDLKLGTKEMQQHVSKVTTYMKQWGLTICQKKSCFQVFTNKRKVSIIIRINQHAIPQESKKELLGVILDAPKLTFGAHIKNL